MFYIIGLGLSDEKDVTLRGLEVIIILVFLTGFLRPSDPSPSYQAIKNSSRVYLEAYTSILMIQKERLVRGPILPHRIPGLTPLR